MTVNMRGIFFAALLLVGFCGGSVAADVKTHVLGGKALALDPANDTVNAGVYAATTLSAVDTDLTVGNIRVGVSIFGVSGTIETAPPAPAVGGAWLLVPGDSTLGTREFWVQKYEARSISNVPTSEPAGLPWTLITQTEAKLRCEALGPGYHLLTMPEALTVSRNIESNSWNWTGGAVGSGGLWRGHTDGSPNEPIESDRIGDPDDDPYVGTGNTSPSIEKRIFQLSTGQYIWDWSGNVYEWLDMTVTPGAGAGYWYDSGAAWIEWADANLADYEKVRAGPAGAYTSAQNAGKYYGSASTGNVVIRGGAWERMTLAGAFAINTVYGPGNPVLSTGFRCGR